MIEDTVISEQKEVVFVERRKARRAIEGWDREVHLTNVPYIRKLHGHHLYVKRLVDGQWGKWLDGYSRGVVPTLKLAKEQLEREAAGEGTSWGIK